jgi:hypothetical protein
VWCARFVRARINAIARRGGFTHRPTRQLLKTASRDVKSDYKLYPTA